MRPWSSDDLMGTKGEKPAPDIKASPRVAWIGVGPPSVGYLRPTAAQPSGTTSTPAERGIRTRSRCRRLALMLWTPSRQ